MSKGIANAFRVPELRGKILLTVLILLLYRFGAYLPVPGAPFQEMLSVYQNGLSKNGAMAVLNLFRVALFLACLFSVWASCLTLRLRSSSR